MATSRRDSSRKSETVDESTTKTINDPFSSGKSKGVIGNATRIVFKAASVLEEEIAKGIIAAKKIEGKVTDVPKLQNGVITNNKQVDELVGRFRKDAHDIMDLILDFAAIAAQNAQRISGQLISVKQTSSKQSEDHVYQVSLIQVPGELRPGEEKIFPITLENDNPSEKRTISFETTRPADTNGNQLPATAISFDPNPLVIAAASKGTVNVKVAIPKTAKPGSYTCFVQAKKMEALKATILIKVV